MKYFTLLKYLIIDRIRVKENLFWMILFPILSYVIFTNLYSFENSELFLVTGIIVNSAFSTAIFVIPFSIITSVKKGFIKRFYLAKISKATFVLFQSISTFILFIISNAVFILFTKVYSKNLDFKITLDVVLLLTLYFFLYTYISIFLCNFFTKNENPALITNLIFFPLMFVSELFFPLNDNLPFLLDVLKKYSPIRAFVLKLRSVVIDGQTIPLEDYVKIFILIIIFYILSSVTFKWFNSIYD